MNDEDFSDLEKAILDREAVAIDELLSSGAEVENKRSEYNIFDYACMFNDVILARKLLKCGASIHGHPRKRQPIFWAVQEQSLDMLNFCLANGVSPNVHETDRDCGSEYMMTPLRNAAAEGFIMSIDPLLAAGADINAQDFEESKPLHLALLYEQFEFAEILVKKGARTDIKDQDSVTVISISKTVACPFEI